MEKRAYSFPKTSRIRSRIEFGAVFEGKVSEKRGPLVLYSRPNGLAQSRLGISIGRAAGTAVKRNRIKRLVREAFRLLRRDLPTGYDLIVVIRPHAPMILAEYQRLLSALTVKAHQVWKRKG